jgi:SagB-type dehydrogenase family enzyme
MTPHEQVIRYHEQTKHHFFRYARALGYLDWANQPDPFRRYSGAPLIPLPILRAEDAPASPPYADLYRPGTVPSEAVTLKSVSRFFEYALSLTAWKQAGDTRWALRSNPSSGNLHPTEGYILLDRLPGLAPHPALYHYAPKEHGLELRAQLDSAVHRRLMAAFPSQAFLVGFSSIHWREAWKYGERAFRYCQHDAGHAIGAARLAAAALGWRMVLFDGTAEATVAHVLGLDRLEDYADAEREHPDCLALVWPAEQGPGQPMPLLIDRQAVEALAPTWYGQANRLSKDEPVPWEIIDEVAAATIKSDDDRRLVTVTDWSSHVSSVADSDRSRYPDGVTAGQVIRQRRSALAFDGKTGLVAPTFYAMLRRVMPKADSEPTMRTPAQMPSQVPWQIPWQIPWDVWPYEPCCQLAIFVHRVKGLPQGLYCLVRNPSHRPALQAAMHGRFLWSQPAGIPSDLPLFLLEEGDARRVATQVSCHQDIAGDSVFSLGMIVEFEEALQRHGAWFYRRLFWETGLIGQVLYLEAEAAGVRATGIGCFFDDPMHDVLGFKGRPYQSLYHFTTGGHVDDPRLSTLPPYEFLKA